MSAQTTVPPVWLHWLEAVHVAPKPNAVPVPGDVPPPQTPFAQISPEQQVAELEHGPPALRQQLSVPSVASPLSAQIVVPPTWLHWLKAVQYEPGGNSPETERSVQSPFRQ